MDSGLEAASGRSLWGERAKKAKKGPRSSSDDSLTFDEVVKSHEDGGSYFLNQKVNYYTFKTDMQDKMLDLVKPCIEKQLEDRQVMSELQLHFNRLSKRVQKIEACFNQQQGRNKVFDEINERITVAEAWQRQNQASNEMQMRHLGERIDWGNKKQGELE